MYVEVVALYLLIAVCCCVVAIYRINQEKEKYKSWYENESKMCMTLSENNYTLNKQNIELKLLLQKESVKKATKTVPYENKDIIDAVKYAMKFAHPDNGGKQEDFIKFNNLYKKIR